MKVEPNKLCPKCKHPGDHHFTATDEIGYWAFCVLQDCECFIDDREDENRT